MAQGRKPFRKPKEKPEFDQQIVDLARVTRVTKGGKQMSFRVTVLIGDRKGRVGYGVQKGKDVQIAVEKAVNQAKKNIITVPIVDGTIPHRVDAKYKAAKVMIKPAPMGSGIIAGSAIRTVLEFAGIPNASSKMIGRTNNKITNIKATFQALTSFHPTAVAEARKPVTEKKEVKKVEKTAPKAEAKKTTKPKPKAKPKAAVKVAKKAE
jgi:small subunit ribosomal protein S5